MAFAPKWLTEFKRQQYIRQLLMHKLNKSSLKCIAAMYLRALLSTHDVVYFRSPLKIPGREPPQIKDAIPAQRNVWIFANAVSIVQEDAYK